MADEKEVPDRWTPEVMLKVKRISSVQVSPDGARAAIAVKSAVMTDERSEFRTHIHLGIAGQGNTRQLTQGDVSCEDPQWSPDGDRVAFLSARNGVKNLWIIRPDGGEAIPLTDLPTEIVGFKWNPAGDRIAFIARDALTPDEEKAARAGNDAWDVEINFRRQRLYVIQIASRPTLTRTAKLLTPGEINVGGDLFRPASPPFDWSPDGWTIVFSHAASPRPEDWPTANLSVVDVESGEIRPLVQTSAAETAPWFSPNGKQIAFLSSDDPPTWAGKKHLCVIPAAGNEVRRLPETEDGFGRYSDLIGWAEDGQALLYTEAQGTHLRLMSMPLEGEPVEISRRADELGFRGMSLSGMFLNSKRTHVGFGWEDLEQPAEPIVARLAEWEPRRVGFIQEDLWPRAANANVWPLPVRTDVIRWKSHDGLEIEGLLTYPRNYQPGKRYPTLLVIHGGPMGVFTQSFDGNPGNYPIAAFAEKGYAVLRPNPRGSSGYGAKFRYANYGDWGGGDYQDLMTGIDQVIKLGIADEQRLGVMGWSYGGYMTSWIITQTKRFRAASVGAGVTNLMSFTGTADIPGFLPDYFGGEFWNGTEVYQTRSPMHHIRGVSTPTLIQHGERDERVPLSQGQELYNALKRQKCETRMIVYPRTPHGIEEPRLMLDCMERNLAWFDEHLGSK